MSMFTDITNFLNNHQEVEPEISTEQTIYEDNVARECNIIRNIKAMPINIEKPPPPMIEADEFDPTNNVLDDDVCTVFMNDLNAVDDDIFSRPESTTVTMEGFLANVNFHESDLIEYMLVDQRVLRTKCNYGDLIYEFWSPPVKVKRTNRGRKKKERKKRHRKIQGNGDCFNSQMTFIIRAGPEEYEYGQIIPSDVPVYKFKVFRTGKLQLPGIKPHIIKDVIQRIDPIVSLLNFALHTFKDVDRPARIINLNPVMKNYKFKLSMPDDSLINLHELRRILSTYKADPTICQADGVICPPISDIKYTREDTKLSIKFITPIFRGPKKNTRINIFMCGRINILGGFDNSASLGICEFLQYLFTTSNDKLIVSACKQWKPLQNIDYGPEDIHIMQRFIDWVPPEYVKLCAQCDIAEVEALCDEYIGAIRARKNAIVMEHFGPGVIWE